MKRLLSELLGTDGVCFPSHASPEIEITGLHSDSRAIRPGNVFFAMAGSHDDGTRYIASAVKGGAIAVALQEPPTEMMIRDFPHTLFIQSDNLRRLMAVFAHRFYQTNCDDFQLIAITGTNGKTTTATIIRHGLMSVGLPCLFIGTTGLFLGDQYIETDYTTPPSFEIHRLLADAKRLSIRHVVMEVSSHALKLDRVWGLRFDAAIFTNLSHEHAELHQNVEDYFQTKRSLFSRLKPDGLAIVNVADPFGKRLAEETPGVPLCRLSGSETDCHWIAHSELSEWVAPQGRYRMRQLLPGLYNAVNQLSAIVALEHIKVDVRQFNTETFPGVDGRFECYSDGKILVIIDFAHTPDGLDKLLTVARSMRSRELICMFGCPGSRDRTKRPLMGRIATQLADHTIVTTDDIHFEEPAAIIQDITGELVKRQYEVVQDRRDAIRRGFQIARDGDILVIAGRGHERYQYVGHEKIPFLDRTVMLEEAASVGRQLVKKKGLQEGRPWVEFV